MVRRKVLLIVAALVATLGTTMVYLYVRGADDRAHEKFDAVQVLRAVETIPAGESLQAAQAAGKIELGEVGRDQVLAGARNETSGLEEMVALTTLYPGEQIISERFGVPGDTEVLTIPDDTLAISVNLTDPSRVAGFVNPGAEVAIFHTALNQNGEGYTRMLMPRVEVIGVGTTTVVPTTTTNQEGQETTEQLPRTLLTLSVKQDQAEKVLFAAANGELAFALLTEKSTVEPGPGVTAKNLFP